MSDYVTSEGRKPLGFPIPPHLPKRKDTRPRVVSEEGLPLWRVSYTDKRGKRCLTIVPKPKRSWAQVWATRQARESGWTKLTIGRWHGSMDFTPAPFVPGPCSLADAGNPPLGDESTGSSDPIK